MWRRFMNCLLGEPRPKQQLESAKTTSSRAHHPAEGMESRTMNAQSTVHPQQQSCLFNTLPGEIRNRIFDYALSSYTNKESPYPTNEYYYRPQFRYGDQYFDTALLRTCRLVYTETIHLPASRYVAVEYHSRDPPSYRPLTARAITSTIERLQHLHLFTQQCWLEGAAWDGQAHCSSLQTLKITLRHSDWWYWESSEPLAFDPLGDISGSLRHDDTGIFNLDLRPLTALRKLELELETVEGKQAELDQIVETAPTWRFPLDKPSFLDSLEPTDPDILVEEELVLNPAKTCRWGWWGERLPSGDHVDNDPVKAKDRLVKHGVDFTVPDGEPEILAPDRLTYYVVNLVFERRERRTDVS